MKYITVNASDKITNVTSTVNSRFNVNRYSKYVYQTFFVVNETFTTVLLFDVIENQVFRL